MAPSSLALICPAALIPPKTFKQPQSVSWGWAKHQTVGRLHLAVYLASVEGVVPAHPNLLCRAWPRFMKWTLLVLEVVKRSGLLFD